MGQNILEIGFANYLKINIYSGYKYLLAVSGGVDSMVLLELFRMYGLEFHVAHCNFQLRGKDSFLDESLVKDYCDRYNILLHSIRFDVKAYQQTGNFSEEMACRDLRYRWFEDLLIDNQLDRLVTAHHLDDNVETFLINISRGTGLKGLTGMQIDNGKIFRPLLEFTKDDLLNFARTHKVIWREDYTNEQDNFKRNKIRHHVLPILKEVHPQFNHNFLKTISYLSETNKIIQDKIKDVRKKIFVGNNPVKILIKDLERLNPIDTYLYSLFEIYGFKSPKEIIKFLKSKIGSEIQSNKYRLIRDRDYLLLEPIALFNESEMTIIDNTIRVNSSNLKFEKSKTKSEEAVEIVDFSSISFPLRVRRVKDSDYFYPIGMDGKKKLISKFMKDLKLSKLEKEKVWLLCDQDDKIIWVINYRLDERFKLRKKSKNFLNIIIC